MPCENRAGLALEIMRPFSLAGQAWVGALLSAAYKDLRAAVAFIRREQEDQDDFAPAIRGGGRPSKQAKAEEPAKPEEPNEPSKPADPEKPRSLTRGLVDEPSDDPFDKSESK